MGKNTIKVKDRYNYNSIVMSSDVNIDAQCRFPAFVSDVSSDSFDNSPATVQAGAHGNAYFHFDAAFYTDATFTEETNDEQMVGEKVYFGITQSTGINGLSFVVRDCNVRNYHDSQNFYVFENFRPNEIVNNDEVVPEFETSDMFKLSYHAFQFSGNYDKEVVQMEMHCSIEVCIFGTCPSASTIEFVRMEGATTYDDAKRQCAEMNGHVAFFKDEDEFEKFMEDGNKRKEWLGIEFMGPYNHVNNWKTSDGGEEYYKMWNNGEPNGGFSEPCAEINMNDTGRYNDIPCDQELPFSCRIDP